MKYLKFLAALCLLLYLSSCSNYKVSTSDTIIDFPDEEAEFPGGPEALKKYLGGNIIYPDIAIERGDQGKVFVQFVVEKNGSLSNINIVRGVSQEIDKESKRVVSEMPKWEPAKYKKEIVRSRVRIPLNYVLED